MYYCGIASMLMHPRYELMHNHVVKHAAYLADEMLKEHRRRFQWPQPHQPG